MADTAPETDAPADRKTGSASDTQREPGRNESMAEHDGPSNVTELLSSGDPVAVAAIASVALSLFTYYVRGKRQQGQFIGLWAPTLLAMASYVEERTGDD